MSRCIGGRRRVGGRVRARGRKRNGGSLSHCRGLSQGGCARGGMSTSWRCAAGILVG